MPLLINGAHSLLIVIDVQPVFLRKLAPSEGERLLQRIGWLIGVAEWLKIPIIVTAEDISREGAVDPLVAERLPPDTPVYDKMIFDLTSEPAIMAAVTGMRRTTAVLVGLETDVCVAQSALGLIDQGYQVVVVSDATGAPGTAHQFGLERVHQAGGILVSVKGLFYEWLRTVERAHQFRQERPQLGIPDGIIL